MFTIATGVREITMRYIFLKHHHSGGVYQIAYSGDEFKPENIVSVSTKIDNVLVPWLGNAEDHHFESGGPILLAWAKMQLWEAVNSERG